MKNIIKFASLLLVLGLVTQFTFAAENERKPDAILRLSGGSFAVGVGFSWGGGTLTYKGKDYPVSVNGLSLGKVGITGASAYGEVYNLKNIQDFSGHYEVAGAGRRGVTLVSGQSGTAMTNQAGVKVLLAASQRGVDVNLTGGGADMKLK